MDSNSREEIHDVHHFVQNAGLTNWYRSLFKFILENPKEFERDNMSADDLYEKTSASDYRKCFTAHRSINFGRTIYWGDSKESIFAIFQENEFKSIFRSEENARNSRENYEIVEFAVEGTQYVLNKLMDELSAAPEGYIRDIRRSLEPLLDDFFMLSNDSYSRGIETEYCSWVPDIVSVCAYFGYVWEMKRTWIYGEFDESCTQLKGVTLKGRWKNYPRQIRLIPADNPVSIEI